MADFSKQWCELNDPEMPADFDIEEIAANMENDHYFPIICEGFGFVAIGKNNDGKIILAFRDDNDQDYIKWQEYDTFMLSQYTELEKGEENNDDKIF
jgi:hypothetical protein